MKGLFDNKIFKLFYTLFRVCFILIIVLYLSFIIVQRLSGNKSIFGYRLFNVATGSMTGVYDINDVIAVKDWDTKKLKVGDDVAYRGVRGGLDGLLITHRIIKIEEKEDGSRIFTTQGVNAPVSDPTIEEGQILGKVVGIVPVITQLNHIVKSQLGFFLLVFCPLVLVIVLEVLQTITEIRVEKNEIQKIEKNISEKKESKKKEDAKKIDSSEDEEKKHSEEEKEKVEEKDSFDSRDEDENNNDEESSKDDLDVEEQSDLEKENDDESVEDEEKNHSEEEDEKVEDVDENGEESPEIVSVFDSTRELSAELREKIHVTHGDDKNSEPYVEVPTIEEEEEKKDDIEVL